MKRIIGLICLIIIVWGATPARAEIKYIDLTNPFIRKIPMAIPVFRAIGPGTDALAKARPYADELWRMLEFSGYFKMLDRGSYLHDPQNSGIEKDTITFGNWKTVGAELLITGGLRIQGGDLIIELRLFDTFKATLLVGRRYRGMAGDMRTVAKTFSAEVLKVITGNRGFYDSRLAFVSRQSGVKEIYVCDFDGTNVRRLTRKGAISSYPAWSSDSRYLAYTVLGKTPARIFIHNLQNGSEVHFGHLHRRFDGGQMTPAWVPGRFALTATLSNRGEQEIYMLTGSGKIDKTLTKSRGTDVGATWSPDGKKIAFVSKRSGRPQIYIKDLSTNRANRLTFEGRYNTEPDWSPKGDKIAYSSMGQGEINIVVIDVEGNNPVQLTRNQGDNEAPSWSPDGSLIAFKSTREGKSRIYVMTASGTDQRRLLTMPGEQSHPKWSPNIPY